MNCLSPLCVSTRSKPQCFAQFCLLVWIVTSFDLQGIPLVLVTAVRGSHTFLKLIQCRHTAIHVHFHLDAPLCSFEPWNMRAVYRTLAATQRQHEWYLFASMSGSQNTDVMSMILFNCSFISTCMGNKQVFFFIIVWRCRWSSHDRRLKEERTILLPFLLMGMKFLF